MFDPMVLASPFVQDSSGRVGEIVSVDISPYDEESPAAYVVFDGCADWVNLRDLEVAADTEASAA